MFVRIALFGVFPLAAVGCAHVPPSRGVWGEDATVSPAWAAVRRAALDAAKAPYTWAPVVAAAALQIGDADEEIADSLRQNQPLFGSAAADVSDVLRGVSIGTYVALGLGAPGPKESADWRRTKARGSLTGGVRSARRPASPKGSSR